MRRIGLFSLIAGVIAVWAPAAQARPVAPDLFCKTYPTAPVCAPVPACTLCHALDVGPPGTNVFGAAVSAELAMFASKPFPDAVFQDHLGESLLAIEGADSDGDGTSNIDEILLGTHPGDAKSAPSEAACPDSTEGLAYSICKYDPPYAFRRVSLDFCGTAPSFAEMEAIRAKPLADQIDAVDQKLTECLDSEFWLAEDGQLWALAHRKIRPVAGLDRFANPKYDYGYFAYTQTDDHDVRDLLVGQYLVKHIKPDGGAILNTSYVLDVNEENFGPGPAGDMGEGKQPMQKDRRAGLLTTAWPLFYYTMFTAIPRSTAAQAYRAFLNWDIARSEGLFPVSGAPGDYDGAGVSADGCKDCHSTLDPLAQPYKNYTGLQPEFYTYNPLRMELYFADKFPGIEDMPEAGSIFGQPVKDLLEWAQVAANSDRFFQATTEDYFRFLIGVPAPKSADEPGYAEFDVLWKALKGHHSVEKMLHAFVKTEVYGAP